MPWAMGGLFLWSAFRLSAFHVHPAFFSSDFLDYCLAMATLEDPALELWPDRRSRAAALLSWPFLGRGVVPGLYMGTQLALVLTGAGIYQWARSLAGPLAGVVAVLLGVAMGPNMGALRMLSFYPTLTATMVFAGLMVAMAWTRARPQDFLGLGLSVGACLLVDVRGALWAVPALLSGLAAVGFSDIRWGARRWGRPLALVLLLLPVALSWPVAELAYPEHAVTLEGQLDVSNLTNTPEFGEDLMSGFVWGSSPPSEWLDSARTLLTERDKALALIPDNARLQPPGARNAHVLPWRWPALLALVSGGVFLVRRPRVLAGLTLSLLPFGVALYGALNGLDLQLRFLSHIAPALAVLLGVGLALPAQFLADAWVCRDPRRGRAVRATQVLGVGLLALAVYGLLPSPLAPDAAWRQRWSPGVAQLRAAIEVRAGSLTPDNEVERTQACAQSLGPRSAAFHPGD